MSVERFLESSGTNVDGAIRIDEPDVVELQRPLVPNLIQVMSTFFFPRSNLYFHGEKTYEHDWTHPFEGQQAEEPRPIFRRNCSMLWNRRLPTPFQWIEPSQP
jgi:hypothetical protein